MRKKTPVTPGGLRKYDHLSPADALVSAWINPGSHPRWDEDRKQELRDGLPLIARHLDRLVEEKKSAKSPVHVVRDAPAACYLIDEDGLVHEMVPQGEFARLQEIAETLSRGHISDEVYDIMTPDEERAGHMYRCAECKEFWPCSVRRVLSGGRG